MTLDQFEAFARQLTLDNGRPFVLEPFQKTMLADFFAGTRETLILLPKKQGKTSLLGALALAWLVTTPDAECVIAAASRDQAGIMLRQATGFIRRSPALQSRLVVKQREIVHRQLGGRVRVIAADVDTADGLLVDLALVDEWHRHRDSDLYGILRDGLAARDGRLVTISTAGSDRDSPLWKARQAALELGAHRDGAYLRGGSPDGSFVLHEWSLREGDDLNDLELVKTANPLAAMTVERLRERKESPTMTPWQWARFACNVWTQSESPWLPAGAWEACEEPGVDIPEGADVWLGVDLGLKHDSAAVVAVHEREDERLAVRSFVIDPPGDGTSLDIGAVEDLIRRAGATWAVRAVTYDPWRFERSAQMLTDQGVFMVDHPMTNSRMAPESEALYEAINSRRIAHDGDPVLAQHVAAGVTTETDRGWRLTKRRARDRIDALIALVMAVDLATRKPEEPRKRLRSAVFL